MNERRRVEAARRPARPASRCGAIDRDADEALAGAYATARTTGSGPIVLDFAATDYINSTGIALIVRLLAEARRDRRPVRASGLSDHYREIFRITRLSDFIASIGDGPAADARHARRHTMTDGTVDVARRPSARSSGSRARSLGRARRRSWTPTPSRRRRRAGDHPRFRRPRLHEQRWHRPAGHAPRPRPARGQRLLAVGLNEHYRQIFSLTRLDEAIGIHDTRGRPRGGRRPAGRRPEDDPPMTAHRNPASPRPGRLGPPRRPARDDGHGCRHGHRHRQARRRARPGLRPDVAEDIQRPRWRAWTWARGASSRTGRSASRPSGRRARGSTRRCPGSRPGEVALLEVQAVPGAPLRMSTGVMVIYADRESFTFMTPEGHALSAWITFSAYRDGDATVAQAQALERTADPFIELSCMLGANRMNDRFWEQTLENLARSVGRAGPGSSQKVCVDRRRQWRYVRNLRHSAALIMAVGDGHGPGPLAATARPPG